jgi:hypothetical protein
MIAGRIFVRIRPVVKTLLIFVTALTAYAFVVAIESLGTSAFNFRVVLTLNWCSILALVLDVHDAGGSGHQHLPFLRNTLLVAALIAMLCAVHIVVEVFIGPWLLVNAPPREMQLAIAQSIFLLGVTLALMAKRYD